MRQKKNLPTFFRSNNIFLLILLLSKVSMAANENRTAKELFEQINSRFDSLTSLSYTVTRTTLSETKAIEEKWDFCLKSPDRIKIEYYKPTHRLIVMNKDAIWEYIPSQKKALRTDFNTIPEKKKLKTISSFMSHVTVDGLRLGDYSKMLKGVIRITTEKNNTCIVEGQNPKFVVYVDRERKTLLRSEVYDGKGELMIQTDASHFTKVGSEFWFPQQIKIIYRSKDSLIKSHIEITNICLNDNPADEIFLFTPPEGTKILQR